MLIVFDLTTGVVLGNSGTNTSYPEGPDSIGVFDNAGELRLHDLDDAELVAHVLNSRYHVNPETGFVVIDEEYPPPVVPVDEVPPLTADEILALRSLLP